MVPTSNNPEVVPATVERETIGEVVAVKLTTLQLSVAEGVVQLAEKLQEEVPALCS